MNARTSWARIGPLAAIAVGAALLGFTIEMLRGHAGVQPGAAAPAAGTTGAPGCAICGAVVSIKVLEVRDETADGGADAGSPAVLQPDGRPGRAEAGHSATILGFTGGDLIAGEPAVKKRPAYRVTVRMDDGSFRAVSLSSPPALAVGDKVRVVEGKLVRG